MTRKVQLFAQNIQDVYVTIEVPSGMSNAEIIKRASEIDGAEWIDAETGEWVTPTELSNVAPETKATHRFVLEQVT